MRGMRLDFGKGQCIASPLAALSEWLWGEGRLFVIFDGVERHLAAGLSAEGQYRPRHNKNYNGLPREEECRLSYQICLRKLAKSAT